MAMKEWFRRMQPVQLYLVLALSIAFVLTELVVSHITHALTLLVDSYHMICNIIALTGCIITIKYGKENQNRYKNKTQIGNSNGDFTMGSNPSVGDGLSEPTPLLKNTFGWARIDVIMMLICFVFLASLCFSTLVEALQTLVHIDHHDEMHHPIPVLIVGACGLLLNGICYLLIGGYTFHQGSFLHVTASGDVVLDRVVTKDSVKMGQRRLSRSRPSSIASQSEVCNDTTGCTHPGSQIDKNLTLPANSTTAITTTSYAKKYAIRDTIDDETIVDKRLELPEGSNGILSSRQGAREMTRDILGCIYVIICSILVYYTDNPVAKFVDPIVSIVSAIHLLWLSYPYMKESGLILLQTMPDTINIESLKSELLEAFPDIVNIHDLHVWQLTATKVISTAHIIFTDPKVYAKITKDVTEFFIAQGITQVTVQPEFSNTSQGVSEKQHYDVPEINDDHTCLMRCRGADCTSKHCCAHHIHQEDTKIHKRWTSSKEIIPTNSIHDLKAIRIHPFEFPPIEGQPSQQQPQFSVPCTQIPSQSASTAPKLGQQSTLNYSKSAQDISTNTVVSKNLHSNYDSLYNIDKKNEVLSTYFEKNAPLFIVQQSQYEQLGLTDNKHVTDCDNKINEDEEPLRTMEPRCDNEGDCHRDNDVECASL